MNHKNNNKIKNNNNNNNNMKTTKELVVGIKSNQELDIVKRVIWNAGYTKIIEDRESYKIRLVDELSNYSKEIDINKYTQRLFELTWMNYSGNGCNRKWKNDVAPIIFNDIIKKEVKVIEKKDYNRLNRFL